MPDNFEMSHVPFDAFEDGLPDARLGARERLELLCDPGSIQPIGSAVRSRRIGARARPGDGVVAAWGEIDGRSIFCFAQDYGFIGGSLGEAQADTIVRGLALAREVQVPVVGMIESGGARVQEGTAALSAYGRIFKHTIDLSGRVPLISIVSGISAGGGSYAPALTDFIVMTRRTNMFLTGPGVVRAALGEEVTPEELGGSRVHAKNGVCQFVVPTDVDAAFLVRELLSFLPQNVDESPPGARPGEPLYDDPSAFVPAAARKVYDVRDVARGIVDRGKILEVAPRWARNMMTGFAHLEGRAIGIVANQPRFLGGVIDSQASEKAARFVRTCDTFGIPLVVLVDTPGFLPGRRQELRGVIRHGASLLRAFASAAVPRLTVVLRQAYGGAYITMNAKELGADFAFAWPGARIGIMAALQAVSIVERRAIDAAPDPEAHRLELARHYAAEHQNAHAAAADGFIDEVIEPADTRRRLSAALTMLSGKSRRAPTGRFDAAERP